MEIILYVLVAVALCFLILLVVIGRGETLGEKMADAFRRILRWADIDISSPQESLPKQPNQKMQKREQKAYQDEDLLKHIADLKQSSDKSLNELYLEQTKVLQSELALLRQDINNQSQELASLKNMLIEQKKCEKDRKHDEPKTPVKEITKYPMIKYGRLVDNNSPKGFIDSNLSINPVGCCFVVEIVSEMFARYRLVDETDMKKEALQMFDPVISTGCQYDAVPTIINDAVNIEDGLLRLRDGIWVIESKNKVKLL